MTHLIERLNVTYHVIDFWGSEAPSKEKMSRDASTGLYKYETSIASWAPSDHHAAVMKIGKGDYQLTWAHFVKKYGRWDKIASITRGSSKDPSIVGRYWNSSVDFLYLDTSHDNSTILELEL